MSPEEQAELQAVADGAAEAISNLGWLPVKVIVLAEVLADDQAKRSVLIAHSDDLMATDTLGLLHYAVARETGAVMRGDEDD